MDSLLLSGELSRRYDLAPGITVIEAGNQDDVARRAAHALAVGMAEALEVSADGRVGFGLVGGEAAEALKYLGEELDAVGVPRDAVVAFQLDERRNKQDQNWPGLHERRRVTRKYGYFSCYRPSPLWSMALHCRQSFSGYPSGALPRIAPQCLEEMF